MIGNTRLDALHDQAWQLLDRGKARAAIHLLEQALAHEELNGRQEADTRHLLGIAHGEAGDRRAMVREWLHVRQLDEHAERAAPLLSADRFQQIAEGALAELPAALLERLGDVAILVDSRPSERMVRDGIDPRLLGLFSGLPLPDQSSLGGGGFPQVIQLFRANLEAEAHTREELGEQIRITVLHETAHFFGLSDEELERMGLG